jgi:hypothetical protein
MRVWEEYQLQESHSHLFKHLPETKMLIQSASMISTALLDNLVKAGHKQSNQWLGNHTAAIPVTQNTNSVFSLKIT